MIETMADKPEVPKKDGVTVTFEEDTINKETINNEKQLKRTRTRKRKTAAAVSKRPLVTVEYEEEEEQTEPFVKKNKKSNKGLKGKLDSSKKKKRRIV